MVFWISFTGPHEPFDVSISWRCFHCEVTRPENRPYCLDYLEKCSPEVSVLSRKLKLWLVGMPLDSVRTLRAKFADHAHLLDVQFGRIM